MPREAVWRAGGSHLQQGNDKVMGCVCRTDSPAAGAHGGAGDGGDGGMEPASVSLEGGLLGQVRRDRPRWASVVWVCWRLRRRRGRGSGSSDATDAGGGGGGRWKKLEMQVAGERVWRVWRGRRWARVWAYGGGLEGKAGRTHLRNSSNSSSSSTSTTTTATTATTATTTITTITTGIVVNIMAGCRYAAHRQQASRLCLYPTRRDAVSQGDGSCSTPWKDGHQDGNSEDRGELRG